jgi:hypothetical protein
MKRDAANLKIKNNSSSELHLLIQFILHRRNTASSLQRSTINVVYGTDLSLL